MSLLSVALQFHVLTAGALHVKQGKETIDGDVKAPVLPVFEAKQKASSEFPWPHIPTIPTIKWPWSHGDGHTCNAGNDECGILAGQSAPPMNVSCSDGPRWMAPNALLVPGRNGKDALYCPVPKSGTSFMYSMMLNLSLGTGGTRNDGYRQVAQIVKDNDKHEIERICKAYSFVIIRNPWDRIVSAYVDKVLTTEAVTYPMDFAKFMKKIEGADPSFLNPHFKPASVTCKTTGDQRHIYDKVIHLEDNNLQGEIVNVFSKKLLLPEQEVRNALDAGCTHSSSHGRVADLDKSVDSGLDKTTYYFQESDPGIVGRVYKDDVDYGHYWKDMLKLEGKA